MYVLMRKLELAMPTIEISDADFRRLQEIAEPLIDSPSDVCRRLLDLWFQQKQAADSGATAAGRPEINVYRESDLPALTKKKALLHTKLLAGQFGGRKPEKQNWDALVRLALVAVIDEHKTVEDLRRLSGANVVSGLKTDEGYKPVQQYGFSYQGVSAPDAVDIILRCARSLKQSVYVEFEWRDKAAAYRPGERAAIRFGDV
jgi:hypothetical protein